MPGVRLSNKTVVRAIVAFVATLAVVNIASALLVRIGVSAETTYVDSVLLAIIVALAVVSLELQRARQLHSEEEIRAANELTRISQATNEQLKKEIAERQVAQESARASETKFAGILDISADAIISISADHHMVLFNQGAERIFGRQAEEMIGQKLDVLLPEAVRGLHVKHIEGFAVGPTATMKMCDRRPVSGVRKDGTEFPAEVTVSRLEIDGEVTFTAILRDISDRVRADESLRRAAEKLEEKVLERTSELAKANQYLHELSGRLLASQEDERRRIARELHDSTSQWLAAALMTLACLESPERNLDETSRVLASDCRRHIEQAASELRTVSYRLHPPLLEEFGLSSALTWYVNGFSKRSGVDIKVQIDPKLPRLSRDVELTIFRIVQEALGNVYRHSGATSARVTIACEADNVRLEVADSGKGMKSPGRTMEDLAPTLGVGVAGMRERVNQLGGVFGLGSDENGTTVSATFPLATDLAKNANGAS